MERNTRELSRAVARLWNWFHGCMHLSELAQLYLRSIQITGYD